MCLSSIMNDNSFLLLNCIQTIYQILMIKISIFYISILESYAIQNAARGGLCTSGRSPVIPNLQFNKTPRWTRAHSQVWEALSRGLRARYYIRLLYKKSRDLEASSAREAHDVGYFTASNFNWNLTTS